MSRLRSSSQLQTTLPPRMRRVEVKTERVIRLTMLGLALSELSGNFKELQIIEGYHK
jgi:hypothetical protein